MAATKNPWHSRSTIVASPVGPSEPIIHHIAAKTPDPHTKPHFNAVVLAFSFKLDSFTVFDARFNQAPLLSG
jgi:hypothetical protein